MDYELLSELVGVLEEFEQHSPGKGAGLMAFSAWLSQRFTQHNDPNWLGKKEGLRPEEVIGVLLRHVYRYGNFYVKKALVDTDFTTVDDFNYLMSLLFVRPMAVKELISRHIHEKPSGMEIVRRLLKKGMIELVPNEADKRSKVIRITDQGRTAAFSVMKRLKQVNDLITRNLMPDEKLQLVYLLQKLDESHNHAFNKFKNMSFDELYEALNKAL